MVEFSYNKNYHESIKIAPFESLYGQKCRSLLSQDELGERSIIGMEFGTHATE